MSEVLNRFDADELRRRAGRRLRPIDDAEALDPAAPALRGDGDLEPGFLPPPGIALRPAAVLVPLVDAGDELRVLLTLRTDDLPSHAGQIAFPGGKIDETDAGPVATALREAEEETGLSPAYVDALGLLDPYLTGTGYRIIPVVGVVTQGYVLVPEAGEVADIFEVPLRFLMDPANHHHHERIWKGERRRYYAMPYLERYIWGATAGILRNLYDRLYRP